MRSGRPSPFRSAAVTESGTLPVAKVCWAAKEGVVAPGAVVFSSTDTVFDAVVGDDEVGLAVAVHVRRPPRSAGSLPVAKVCWAAKEAVVAPGAVVFSSTDTVLSSSRRRR